MDPGDNEMHMNLPKINWTKLIIHPLHGAVMSVSIDLSGRRPLPLKHPAQFYEYLFSP